MKKKTFLLCASFLVSLAISPLYTSHILAEETVNTTTTVQSPVVVSTTETATETSVTTTETSTVVTTTPTSENTTSATTQISEATTGTPHAESAPGKVAIYRLYNPRNGEHLYTTDANEKNVLYKSHGWGYEGIGWYAPDTGTPVYRLYNAGLQNHLYTTDVNEVKVLTSRHGWKSDNNGRPVFYSGGAVNIYRVYNPKLRGLHHWTTDRNEYNILPRHGWHQEGIKFKGIQNGAPIKTQYVTPPAPKPSPAPPRQVPPTVQQPPQPYYPNCDAVRAAGRAPLRRGEPGYRSGLDRDGDGYACEE